jgi:hypothetical protein
LFREFADLRLTKESILSFANKYGRLGGSRIQRRIVLPTADEPGTECTSTGEPLSAWQAEIISMRQAIDLWEMARTGDVEGLSQLIEWRDERLVVYDSGPTAPYGGSRYKSIISGPGHRPDVWEHVRYGEVIEPTRHAVQAIINERLAGGVSPRLLWNLDYTRLEMHIVPSNLIGELWLQFCRAVEGNKQYLRCPECTTWYEIDPSKNRTDKRYCSNACRNRAYRRRKAVQIASSLK